MTKERKQQPENSRFSFVRKTSPPYWNFPAKSQRWTFSSLVSIPLGHRWAEITHRDDVGWWQSRDFCTCSSVSSAKWWSSVDYPFGIYGFQLPWSSMGRMLWWETSFMRYCDARCEHCRSVPHSVILNRLNFFRFCEQLFLLVLKSSLLAGTCYFLSSITIR